MSDTETGTSRGELRAQFLDLISAYSEDTWAAGWEAGVEKTIRRDQGIWLALAVACGGWPNGYRAENGWDPLTGDERAAWARIVGTEGT